MGEQEDRKQLEESLEAAKKELEKALKRVKTASPQELSDMKTASSDLAAFVDFNKGCG